MAKRPAIPARITRQILIESGHRCAVCGLPCPLERAHIVPWHKSREHRAENLICLCASCHERADLEKWGEKTLREYKKKPWVLRQGSEPLNATPKTKLQFIIDIELDQFDESRRRLLEYALSGFLDIPLSAVRTVKVEEANSVKVTVELPVTHANRVVRAYEGNDPELIKYLNPIGLVDFLGVTTRTKRKRRTAGPSEKIRSLAAISLANKVGYLKLSDLYGQNNKAAEAVLDRMPRRNFKAGETIYPSSQKGPVACLVRSGRVNIVRTASTGRDFDVKTVEAGTIFGDMPTLGQSMLGARAVAAEPSKVTFISPADFEKLAAASPSVALNLARQIGPRLVDAERRHEQSAFQPVTSRVASLLLELAGGRKEVAGYTHQQMADMLGVYRETVTNGIAELKEHRHIKVGRKRITLLNLDALRKIETI